MVIIEQRDRLRLPRQATPVPYGIVTDNAAGVRR